MGKLKKAWALMRLDDNGNAFEMERFADKAEAEKTRDVFEKRAHKQHYFVTHKDAAI